MEETFASMGILSSDYHDAPIMTLTPDSSADRQSSLEWPTSDRWFGMSRAAEPGTGHLDALLRSIENNLTARDD